MLSLLALGQGLRFSPNVSSLLPQNHGGAALQTYLRGFGGTDPASVLIRGEQTPRVESAAQALTKALSNNPQLRPLSDLSPAYSSLPDDSSLAWAFASAENRKELGQALLSPTLQARVHDSRSLLLSPGASSVAKQIAKDPIRLWELATKSSIPSLTGDKSAASSSSLFAGSDSGLVGDEGRARLVMVGGTGQTLRSAEASAFMGKLDAVISSVHSQYPDTTMEVSGGYAIARATEQMLRRDLTVSASLSLLLASAVFLAIFRRLRSLVAIVPALAVGTFWTTALAASIPGGVSAISVAFISVVVGVGMDTGVHVYARLLLERRQGRDPWDAADRARKAVARPTLFAAFIAALAFASLSLSDIAALRQLGLLCAAGELLTAVAILTITPILGAILERGASPSKERAQWLGHLGSFVQGRIAGILVAASVLGPVGLLIAKGLPAQRGAVVAVQPKSLKPAQVQREIDSIFGSGPGQWVVLVSDESEDKARQGADKLYDSLSSNQSQVSAIDALTRYAPTRNTQEKRLKERDALDLPSKAQSLRDALRNNGFAEGPFSSAINSLAMPSHEVVDPLSKMGDMGSFLRKRFVAEVDGKSVALVYLRPIAGRESELESRINKLEPRAQITGYARMENLLRASLSRDLPRITLLALALVLGCLGLSLRRGKELAIAVAALVVELIWVISAVHIFHIQVHIYDALVIPVLLGISVDETMFVLYRAREGGTIEEILRDEGPSISATALSTAAGFGALLFCRFDALRDLGLLGMVGSLAGLLTSLVVVPFALVRFGKSEARS